ncbi:hypothetical protein NQ318_004889, partial [Aromia moschata]
MVKSESGSGSGVDVDPNLPYPGIAPIALRYLTQTTRPRSWCLALISNPYPFYTRFLGGCAGMRQKIYSDDYRTNFTYIMHVA